MTPLTDYEATVAQSIAAWKSEKLSLYNRAATTVTAPVASLFSHLLPKAATTQGITAAYSASDWLVGADVVLKHAGLKSLDELRQQPLEFCDKLAMQVDRKSQSLAAVDGAVTGAGGFLLAAADVFALMLIVLRAIRHTGHCYGYALDREEDRPYVLGVLMVACTKTPTERVEMLGKLSNIETWLMNETVEAVMIEGLSKQLIQIASLEAIPGIGAAFGSAANLLFSRHVTRSSRCIFQERWLRERDRDLNV